MKNPTNKPTNQQGDSTVATLTPAEVGALLGIKETKTRELLKQLRPVSWSHAHRPRYRREDVLKLAHGTRADKEPSSAKRDDAEAVRNKAAWAEWNKPAEPFEWPKGSDEVPDWVRDRDSED
jgi:hypothetical protein